MGENERQTFPMGQIPEEFRARQFTDQGEPDDSEAYLESAEPEQFERGRELSELASDWRPAKALLKLRAQVNTKFPDRDKSSDGFIGDTAHCPGTSDHCPLINDHGVGVVAAFDMTQDVAHGCDAEQIVAAVIASRDSRIKYIIWNRHIWNSSPIGTHLAWAKRDYTGANPHNHHAHFSVLSNPAKYDDDNTDWVIVSPTVA